MLPRITHQAFSSRFSDRRALRRSLADYSNGLISVTRQVPSIGWLGS
jgi:hypothetical protein